MLANRPALKQLRHAPVCVGLALVATACSSPTPATPWDRQVKVTGSIMDFQSGAPAGGAHVAIATASATTDAAAG